MLHTLQVVNVFLDCWQAFQTVAPYSMIGGTKAMDAVRLQSMGQMWRFLRRNSRLRYACAISYFQTGVYPSTNFINLLQYESIEDIEELRILLYA